MTRADAGHSELPGEGPAITDLGSATQPDLARDLLKVATIPANIDVLDAALRLVVALARVTVGGADGVSVSLRRHGVLTTVAASDETVTGMDRDQYATGEGPCVAAATEGHWFHVESLEDERRWPAFIPEPGNGASTASFPRRSSPGPAPWGRSTSTPSDPGRSPLPSWNCRRSSPPNRRTSS